MKAILAYLRFSSMASRSKKLGLHQHPEIVKIEGELMHEFMRAVRTEKVANIN